MLAKEFQLILASAKLQTSPPAPLDLTLSPSPNGEGLEERVAREEDLKVIDAIIPEVKDWEAFTKLIINNTTAPLLYSKLKQCKNAQLLPATSLALLRKAYYTTFSRSTLMYAEFGQVVQLFQENNIRFIALKGIYLCDWLYGDLGLRQMSDIDLLVDVHDAEKCMELLRTKGYEQHPNKGLSEFVDKVERAQLTDIIHYDSFHLRDISIEIHIKLTSDKEPFTIDIPSLFRAAVPVEVNGMHIHALHPYDLLIHLTTHTDKHFKVGHVQLTSFSDLVNLLFKIERTKNKEQRQEEEQRAKNKEQRLEEEDVWGEGFSWDGLIARSKEFNCEEVVFMYLVLMHRFYKAPLPAYIVEQYKHTQSDAIDEQFIRYLNGEKFAIETKTVVASHLENIKSIRSAPVFLRYLKEVLFPGKTFMLDKYGLVYSKQYIVNSKKKASLFYKLKTTNYKLIFWWLWYPYRYYCGLKGIFFIITKTNHVKKQK